MSDWDASDVEEPKIVIPIKAKWDDEDAEDDVKESWEESDEEETKNVVQPKPKVPLAQKIAEREAKAAEEKAKKALESKSEKDLTSEELKSLRETQKKLQEEADLQNAADLFGGIDLVEKEKVKAEIESEKTIGRKIESFTENDLKTKADFDRYEKFLSDLILSSKANRNYGGFIEELVRSISEPLKDVELRKISSSLTAAANEKQRAAKEALKGKKKGAKKANVRVEADPVETSRAGAFDDDDYDDFM